MDGILVIVAWEVVCIVAIVALVRKRKKVKRRAMIGGALTKRGAWRYWVEKDGTQDGLQDFLDAWRGKPWEPEPTPAVVVSEPELDKLVAGGGGALERFVERNREKIRQTIGVDVAAAPEQGIVVARFDQGPQGKQMTYISGDPALNPSVQEKLNAILAAAREHFKEMQIPISVEAREKNAAACQAVADALNKPRFKVGQWLRHNMTGMLGQVSVVGGSQHGCVLVDTIQGQQEWGNCEPAIPRKGEWWGFVKPWTPDMACYCVPETWAVNNAAVVEGGHAFPINFGRGRGEEAKG